MKINKHNIILFLAVLIFVANSVVYFYAPEQVPIHWNYAGDIDQYAPKYVLFGLGLLPLAFFYLIPFFKKIDPHSRTIEQRGKKTYLLIRDLVVLLLVLLNVVTIIVILNQEIRVNVLIQAIIGIFMIGLGNYMPRLPRNYFVGFRTPWALNDEDNWYRIQRMGGIAFVVSGFAMLIASLMHNQWLNIFCFVLMILVMVGCCFYSWYISVSQR